jgi:hypothetical protein
VESQFADFCQTFFPNVLPHMLWFALRDFQVTYLSFIGGEDEKDTICRAMGAVIVPRCIIGTAKSKKKFTDLQLAKVVYF